MVKVTNTVAFDSRRFSLKSSSDRQPAGPFIPSLLASSPSSSSVQKDIKALTSQKKGYNLGEILFFGAYYALGILVTAGACMWKASSILKIRNPFKALSSLLTQKRSAKELSEFFIHFNKFHITWGQYPISYFSLASLYFASSNQPPVERATTLNTEVARQISSTTINTWGRFFFEKLFFLLSFQVTKLFKLERIFPLLTPIHHNHAFIAAYQSLLNFFSSIILNGFLRQNLIMVLYKFLKDLNFLGAIKKVVPLSLDLQGYQKEAHSQKQSS